MRLAPAAIALYIIYIGTAAGRRADPPRRPRNRIFTATL
jgi:hypothetical protein